MPSILNAPITPLYTDFNLFADPVSKAIEAKRLREDEQAKLDKAEAQKQQTIEDLVITQGGINQPDNTNNLPAGAIDESGALGGRVNDFEAGMLGRLKAIAEIDEDRAKQVGNLVRSGNTEGIQAVQEDLTQTVDRIGRVQSKQGRAAKIAELNSIMQEEIAAGELTDEDRVEYMDLANLSEDELNLKLAREKMLAEQTIEATGATLQEATRQQSIQKQGLQQQQLQARKEAIARIAQQSDNPAAALKTLTELQGVAGFDPESPAGKIFADREAIRNQYGDGAVQSFDKEIARIDSKLYTEDEMKQQIQLIGLKAQAAAANDPNAALIGQIAQERLSTMQNDRITKIEQAKSERRSANSGYEKTLSTLTDTASRFRNLANNPNLSEVVGIIGGSAPIIPGTVRADIAEDLKSLESSNFIGTLIDAKSQGATFGALNATEGEALRVSKGSLSRAQTYERLKENLEKFADQYEKARDLAQQDYNSFLDSIPQTGPTSSAPAPTEQKKVKVKF